MSITNLHTFSIPIVVVDFIQLVPLFIEIHAIATCSHAHFHYLVGFIRLWFQLYHFAFLLLCSFDSSKRPPCVLPALLIVTHIEIDKMFVLTDEHILVFYIEDRF